MKAKQYSVSADQLVYDYGSMVSAICRRMMQDEEAAREAAQEIWLEVMKSLPPGYILSPIVWLFVAPKKKRYILRNFYEIIFEAEKGIIRMIAILTKKSGLRKCATNA
jgi:hypothetical protein